MIKHKAVLSLSIALLLGLLAHGIAQGPQQQLTIEADRLADGIARVTYVIVHSTAGQEVAEFPTRGGLLAFDELINAQVFELNTQQELPSQIVPAREPDFEGAQAVSYQFPNPVPAGGNYRVEVTIEGVANFITRDAAERWEFTYSTSWNEVFFVLPLGHAIVYASEPIFVYERAGSTVAQGSKTSGQRVRKLHPLGGSIGLGRSPESKIRSRARSRWGSGTGTADRSAWV